MKPLKAEDDLFLSPTGFIQSEFPKFALLSLTEIKCLRVLSKNNYSFNAEQKHQRLLKFISLLPNIIKYYLEAGLFTSSSQYINLKHVGDVRAFY